MKSDITFSAPLTPEFLLQEGLALLRAPVISSPEEITPLEKSIFHAHQVLATSLTQVDRLLQAGKEISYSDVLGGAQFNERVAALTYLITRKLLHIASSPEPVREVVEARRDISQFVEALSRLHAADALGLLYAFADAYVETSKEPQFWQKASLYYLHQMAMLTMARGPVVVFLKEHPQARRQVEQMMMSADPNVSVTFRSLGEEYVRMRKAEAAGEALPQPAEYTALYRRYALSDPDARTLGLSTLLAAQERIQQAVNARDIDDLARWVFEGSPDAVRSVFQISRQGLPALPYVNLLAKVLARLDADPVRLTAAVLELGRINRSVQINGGDPNVNKHLLEACLIDDSALVGVSQLAVRELGKSNAFNDVLTIVEKAPIIEVAEEGILVLRDLRRLPLVESTVNRRPLLEMAYYKAKKHLQEIQNLSDAVWACQNEYMARPYIARLRELNAIRELEVLGQKHKDLGDIANRTLAEIQMEQSTIDEYGVEKQQ